MDAFDRVIYAQTDGGKRIGTARDHLLDIRSGKFQNLRDWMFMQATGRGFKIFLESTVGTIKAEINHGHWIARCNFCAGAEEVDPQEDVFYCLSCGMMENASKPMQVEFPPNKADIEEILLKRPIGNRNWIWTETLAQLRGENKGNSIQ